MSFELEQRISVIIPTFQEEECIDATLQELNRLGEPLEIIVADGGSSDRTREMAARHGARVLEVAGGRAVQLNQGAAQAQGEIVMFLHADTRLPADFLDHARSVLSRPGVVAGAFRLRIDADGWGYRLIEAVANWRSRALQSPYGDQGLFMPKRVFEEVGGFPVMPIMEDFALVARLRRRGRIELAPAAARTSPRRWQQLGLVRTTLVNWGMVVAFWLGVSPDRLADWYRGSANDDGTVRGRKTG